MNLKALSALGYGMYLVSSKDGEKISAQIANTVFQVTAEPPKIAAALNKQNLTCELVKKSGILAISILSENTPMTFIGNFGFKSGRNFNKFEKIGYTAGVTGAPIVTENAVGYLEAKITGQFDAGTHILFVAEIEDARVIDDSKPMTYAYYHLIKKGTSPKTAPTYIKDEAQGR